MRMHDFDSKWHFVPDHPEAIPGFRRTNRAVIAYFVLFVLGLFVAMTVSLPVRNSVTATKFGARLEHKAQGLASQHTALPAPQTR